LRRRGAMPVEAASQPVGVPSPLFSLSPEAGSGSLVARQPVSISGLTVVIPALNESAGIADVARRVIAQGERLAAMGVAPLELVVVDDGSVDGTADAAARVAGVTVIRHPCNRGYGAALKTGFRAASGELLGFLDADGTYPPESLPELCAALRTSGADLAVGSRMAGGASAMPAVRRAGNLFFARMVSVLGGATVSDSASGQRVMTRASLERLYPLPDGLNFTPVMTTRAIHEGLRVVEVPIPYRTHWSTTRPEYSGWRASPPWLSGARPVPGS
jgi:glycosyltransferase involved in cell wall biosynthesis